MRMRFLPLAITRVGNDEACVAGVTEDGLWIRPEPVSLDQVQREPAAYDYSRWSVVDLAESIAEDHRWEDRTVLNPETVCIAGSVTSAERATMLARYTDADVSSALEGQRTVGLIRVTLHLVYAKRATGGRVFLRGAFTDSAGKDYDWIIPELAFARLARPFVVDGQLKPAFAERFRDALSRVPTFFTVGLTKREHRFPGRFKGCHPLVVGIHTVPDYHAFVARW